MDARPTIAEALRRAERAGLDRIDAQLLLLEALRQDADGGTGHGATADRAAGAGTGVGVGVGVGDRADGTTPRDRAWLIAHDREAMPPQALARLSALTARRLAGEPVAYLLGWREFHGLKLQVDARVLDPRPDTETLVDWALERLPPPAPGQRPRVLDLGTGSGAIALAIAHARPDAEVWALDASTAALEVARANAQRLGLPVRLHAGHWLRDWPPGPEAPAALDLIVSNPPYIADGDPHLTALRHEPLAALASGPDGLADLRAIVASAPAALAPGGWLLLEHGWDQAEAVRGLLRAAGLANVETRRDLGARERCSGARRQQG